MRGGYRGCGSERAVRGVCGGVCSGGPVDEEWADDGGVDAVVVGADGTGLWFVGPDDAGAGERDGAAGREGENDVPAGRGEAVIPAGPDEFGVVAVAGGPEGE